MSEPSAGRQRRPIDADAVQRRRLWAAAVVVFGCVGCAESSIDAPVESREDAAAETQLARPPVSDEAAATAGDVKPVNRQEFDAALEGLRGQVVLVDFWATWCAPCMEQLPHTTALAKSRRGDGLAVVTVCMDDPEEAPRIAKLLASRDASWTTNLISRDGGGPRAMDAFEIPGGALPHYRLYDETGRLQKSFELDPSASEQFTSADIDAAVDELLAE